MLFLDSMVWKVISAILVFLIVVFSFAFMFDNLPGGKSVVLTKNYLEPERVELFEYEAVPVFIKNLRFNHNLISYSIDESCDSERRGDMIKAFNIFSDAVKVISFFEVETHSGVSSNKVDILVGCSDDFIELGDNLFAAGEGGPSKIINTSLFRTIEEGKILLYGVNNCRYPIVALHELGHVFGFDHSDDPNNIMYNTSDCGQRMSDDMVELMVELYSIEALSDARISKLDAVLHGRYLDFNISVLNGGLIDIDDIDLTILANGDVVQVVDLGELGIGYGRTLRVENMKIPWGIEEVEFVLDARDLVRELDEGNNFVSMTI